MLLSGSTQTQEIIGVPFVKQEGGYCGPAAVSSVMAYYGSAVDQKTIGDAVYSKKLKGSLISDLENYARVKGFQTRLSQGGMDDIRKNISGGKPVIVLVDMGFWVISDPHYLVVTGFSDREIIAHTGHEALKRFPIKDFETIWKKNGSVFLVIYP